MSKKPDASNLVETVNQQVKEINDLQKQMSELKNIADINHLVNAIEEQGLILTNLEARIQTIERGKSVAKTPSKEEGAEEGEAAVGEDDDDEEVTCKVCLFEEKDTLIMPCGHFCVCHDCAEQLKKKNPLCPMCR